MNVREYFKMLLILHIALIVGQLTFAVIVVFFVEFGGFEPSYTESRNLFLIIAALVTVIGVFISNMLYKKNIELIKNMKELKQKFSKYKMIYIIKYILLEAPSTIAIIFYLLTGDILFLAFTIAIIFIGLNSKPNKEKIISKLELSDDEKKEMENENTIISNSM